MFVRREKCVVCGSMNFTKLKKIDHRDIVKCKKCKMIFCSEYDEEEVEKVYRENYYSSEDYSDINVWLEKNTMVWKGLINSLLKVKPSFNCLLDIGAGAGGLLAAVNEKFPNYLMSMMWWLQLRSLSILNSF